MHPPAPALPQRRVQGDVRRPPATRQGRRDRPSLAWRLGRLARTNVRLRTRGPRL